MIKNAYIAGFFDELEKISTNTELKNLEKKVEKKLEHELGVKKPTSKILKGLTRAGQATWVWGVGGPQRVVTRLALEVPGVVERLKEKESALNPQHAQFQKDMNRLLTLMQMKARTKPNIFGEGGKRRFVQLKFPQHGDKW